MKNPTYTNLHKKAYDVLASEFNDKIEIRKKNSERIFKSFMRYFSGVPTKSTVLEIGPAAGYDTKLFSEAGFKVTAIELSPKLAGFARKNAPLATVIVGDFMSRRFIRKFDVIIAVAFIHLFPKSETGSVLAKIFNLLKPGGICHISTTLHTDSDEGLVTKFNFKKTVTRFRRRFTKPELESEMIQAGFSIISRKKIKDKEEFDKIWGEYIIQKK